MPSINIIKLKAPTVTPSEDEVQETLVEYLEAEIPGRMDPELRGYFQTISAKLAQEIIKGRRDFSGVTSIHQTDGDLLLILSDQTYVEDIFNSLQWDGNLPDSMSCAVLNALVHLDFAVAVQNIGEGINPIGLDGPIEGAYEGAKVKTNGTKKP